MHHPENWETRPKIQSQLVVAQLYPVNSVALSVIFLLVEVSGDATFCTLEDIVHTRRDGSNPMAAGDEGVLIGKPLPGVNLAIVSPERRVVPAGQAGELLVGGIGVALGYHRRPQETAGKFLRSVAHSADGQGKGMIHIPGLEPGHRVVCTGDRVVQPIHGGPMFWLGKLDGEVRRFVVERGGRFLPCCHFGGECACAQVVRE